MFRRPSNKSLRLVSLLGVAAYLAALFTPLAHAEAFGVDPHEHNGHACYVLDLVEASGAALTPPGVEIPAVFFQPVVLEPISSDVVPAQRVTAYESRAPPV